MKESSKSLQSRAVYALKKYAIYLNILVNLLNNMSIQIVKKID